MTQSVSVLICVGRYWKSLLVILTPFLALAVPLYVQHQDGGAIAATVNSTAHVSGERATKELDRDGAWCAYCVIIMAVYWMTEALPIQATALLPILLFPVTGVLSTAETCSQYMNSANALFMGGLMVAAAVEHCGLHLRIALRTLIAAGSGLKWMMLGFMGVTMFLSMWISNTATTAMMTPIIDRIIHILTEESLQLSASGAAISAVPTIDRGRLSAALYISVAYAANCGGTGTLTGTNPNLVLVGQLEELFGDTGLTYASFMMFGVPAMLICTLLAWLWIVLLFLGVRQFKCCGDEDRRFEEVRSALRNRYRELGPLTFHEVAVAALFTLLVLLWFLRDPRFMPGWAELFTLKKVKDATPAILVVVLLFAIPARPGAAARSGGPPASEGLLTWKAAQEKVPWGVLILLGGGFALARAAKVTSLSEWVGDQLSGALSLSPVLLVFLICLFTAMVTEVSSNTATATILLPVLAGMARRAELNPLYLMLPVTLTCSYAFMLPVATPPNAIVHQAGNLRTWDMVKAGLVMNVLCVSVVTLLTNTLGVALFDLHTFPTWANATGSAT